MLARQKPSQALRASSPRGGNNDDRRQWRKQEVVVGAAASKTQSEAPRMLGAATRVRSTFGRPGRLTLDEESFIYGKL